LEQRITALGNTVQQLDSITKSIPVTPTIIEEVPTTTSDTVIVNTDIQQKTNPQKQKQQKSRKQQNQKQEHLRLNR
jgi:hypothetical protein